MATQDRRVAVVTGGARGIGRACAHSLAERGYALVLVDVLAAEMARTRLEIEEIAKELGPHILVNCVCPGLIKTEVVGNAVIREREPELVKGIALKRVGTPRDVAEVLAFLAASEPCFVTGQDIIIDGLQCNR